MTTQDLITALRICSSTQACDICPAAELIDEECEDRIMAEAADVIEKAERAGAEKRPYVEPEMEIIWEK